ncbi:helix-turn-helix domain-containing protein [Streptomyces lichenis]|uniref:HTH luxR-type domain-containing protein n=1 Tax=Streptomyces lichenis TaxID=2306967 RepID=A0ABT0I7V2_9ACTN|nr:helix-turn-helix domain-containing protein [Streptomyces lichenis]MCK8677404.1 hypothetical protein [Streptomyces lichenis]
MIQGELTTLGLGRTEERAYAALLRHRADGAEELARRLGLPRRRLDAALDRLVRHGFASPPDGEGTDGLPRPAQPAAIRSLIHRRQAELHLRSAELERLRLAAERLEPPPDAGTGGEVETVSGRAAVAAWTARLLAGARREVALLDRVPYALRDLPEVGPGVEVRAVLAGPRPAGGSSPDGSGAGVPGGPGPRPADGLSPDGSGPRPGSGSGADGVSGGRRPRPDDGFGSRPGSGSGVAGVPDGSGAGVPGGSRPRSATGSPSDGAPAVSGGSGPGAGTPDGPGSRPVSSSAAGVSGGRRPRPDDGRGASFALFGPGVRMAAEVPVRLLIVDRRTALLPPAQPEDPAAGALLVRDGPLRAALLGLFDTAWERAAPPDPAPGDGALTGPERELLALLAAGLKDEAIARRLGVHVHTARRRISRLLEALDARTRFQAGARASVRGWLEA